MIPLTSLGIRIHGSQNKVNEIKRNKNGAHEEENHSVNSKKINCLTNNNKPTELKPWNDQI
jgi:hypothetical protein